jgi:hypothetical protein
MAPSGKESQALPSHLAPGSPCDLHAPCTQQWKPLSPVEVSVVPGVCL